MVKLGLEAIAGLAAVLVTPVAWLALWLAGAVLMLALAVNMRLWRLHLVTELFGLAVAWISSRHLHGLAERLSRPWMMADGYVGAILSSMVSIPLVALF